MPSVPLLPLPFILFNILEIGIGGSILNEANCVKQNCYLF